MCPISEGCFNKKESCNIQDIIDLNCGAVFFRHINNNPELFWKVIKAILELRDSSKQIGSFSFDERWYKGCIRILKYSLSVDEFEKIKNDGIDEIVKKFIEERRIKWGF